MKDRTQLIIVLLAMLAYGLCVISTVAHAAEDKYTSVDSAALDAARGLPNGMTEAASLIILDTDGSYAITPPQVQASEFHFAVKVVLSKGQKIAGIVHNHPGSDSFGMVFSPDDIVTADRLNVPSYVRFADGLTRVYRPGVTKTNSTVLVGTKVLAKTAKGDMV